MTTISTMGNAARLGCRAAGLLALGFAPLAAHAQATQITSASGLAADDTTLTYNRITDNTFVPSYTGSAEGNTLTFTDAGKSLYESRQGIDYSGNYPDGTNLLGTINSSAAAAGPLTITFASGVTQFGLTAENAFAGSYTFTFSPYSGTTRLGTFTSGVVGETQNAFLGAGVISGSITSVQVSSAVVFPVINPNAKANIFVVGPITFATAAPEPSSVAALSIGVLGIGSLALRARRRSAA